MQNERTTKASRSTSYNTRNSTDAEGPRVLSLVTTATFKFTHCHLYSYHSIGRTWFPISLPL